jgi:hypothetical protein
MDASTRARVRPSSGGNPRSGRLRLAGLLAALGCLVLALPTAAAEGLPEQPRLPELVRTKHRVFSIPFRLPSVQAPDAAPQRVSLSVSRDLGGAWEPAGEVAPSSGSFTYRADADGEYWFRLRAIDAKGRTRGGEGPDIRVLVDAAGPKLAARVWKGGDGEIVCRYAAIDDSLRLDSLAFEYRGPGDQGWKSIASTGILSRESPAHMVGEEIWWAGEKVETLTVRIAIADSAGNKTVRQFTLEPSDPHVDQAALARELGAPPLPTREVAMHDGMTGPTLASPDAAVSGAAPGRGPMGATPAWAAESATTWSADHPLGGGGPAAAAGRMVSARSAGSGQLSGLAPTVGPGLPERLEERDARQPLEYRGKPLQLVPSRRFAWDYEFDAERTASEPMRVELWSTRDGGVTWQRTATDNDTQSPIDVTLPAAGLYGFRLEIVPDLPSAGSGPRSGDAPESWVGVDDEAPQVELLGVTRAQTGEPGGILIRYSSRDQLPAARSVRISYSPNAAGPWATIAESLDAQGEHRWQPDRNVPTRVFVRVEAADAAGNIGTALSTEPVTVATSRVVGKLGGLRVLPAAAP